MDEYELLKHIGNLNSLMEWDSEDNGDREEAMSWAITDAMRKLDIPVETASISEDDVDSVGELISKTIGHAYNPYGPAQLQYEPEDVADWLEDNGYVDHGSMEPDAEEPEQISESTELKRILYLVKK